MLRALIYSAIRDFKWIFLIVLLLAMNNYLEREGATTVERALEVIMAMPLEMLKSIIIDTAKMVIWPALPFVLCIRFLIRVPLEYVDVKLDIFRDKAVDYVERKRTLLKPDTE